MRNYNGKLLLDSVSSPAQFTSNQNNYSLSATEAVLRVSKDASRKLTGIANSGTMQDGRVLTIVNVGSFDLVLTTEDTNSTAANRFALGESNVTLKSNESITLWYDATTDRWRPIDYRASAGGSGITTLNTLTASTQTFNTGTSGSDFNISSSTSTHTFNIPNADAYNDNYGAGSNVRGLISTGTQSFAGTKRFLQPIEVGQVLYTSGAVKFFGAGSGIVTFKVADTAGTWTMTLPSSTGSNGQVLTTNGSGVTSWTTISGGGDITDGGNTTGSAITIGTNDAFGLNFETSGVTRMSITGGASTGGATTIAQIASNTNNIVHDVLNLRTNITGAPTTNFGEGILFQAKSSTTDNQDLARIAAYWTTATHASREGALSFQLGDAAGALAEVMKLDRITSTGLLSIGSTTPVTLSNAGLTGATNFTIASGSSTLTIGQQAGQININTNSTNSIYIHNNANSASSTAGVSLGAANNFTQTSGTRNMVFMDSNFAPTSGTAVHNSMAFINTFNQTGGANGITRSINIAPTITAVADYRALEIASNGTNVKGIYQTGSTATNNFVGRTSFGTTSAPNASALIDMVSTSLGFGLPAMTSTQRDAISSPRQGLVVYNTTDDKISIRRSSDWVDVAPDRAILNAQTGTTYTLVIGDAGKTVTMDNASAMTLTIPANASVAFPIGTESDRKSVV